MEKILTGSKAEFFEKLNLPPKLKAVLIEEAHRWSRLSEAEKAAEREKEEVSRAQEATRQYYARLRATTGLRGTQLQNTFDNYTLLGTRAERDTQARALELAKSFARRFPKVKRGLMFWGAEGRGKDHLLHAIANAIRNKPGPAYKIRYAYSLDLVRELENYERRGDPDEISPEMELRGMHLLLIGDLHRWFGIGEQGAIAARVEESAWRIINQAESTGKPIICATTNFNWEQWRSSVGAGLASRLGKIMVWHEVRGPDRRLTKPSG